MIVNHTKMERLMRNRAKCKLCGDIIESLHPHDFVACKCTEITIDGGLECYKASAKDPNNFLRIDDEGNEIVVTWVDKEEITITPEDFPKQPLTKEEMLQELTMITDRIAGLPEHALNGSVTQVEFWEALILIKTLLEKSND